jgi:hypothetical protein
MRAGALPAALLCLALGLGLASAEQEARIVQFAILGVTACAIALAPIPETGLYVVSLGCWTSIIATAAMVHGPRRLQDSAGLALTLNAAVWTGAVIALSPSKLNLLEALPLALCAWPAAWVRRRGQAIVLKVLASWLMAVAMLGATLQFLPVTPGYLPDHME